MNVPKLSFPRRFKSRYGMKSWPKASCAALLKVSDCTEILLYLKRCAGLPETAVVWEKVKVSALVKSTINRKIWFHATTLALLFLVGFAVLISLARIISDISIRLELKINEAAFNLLFAALLSAIVLLFWKRRSVGRDRSVLFRDYFSDGLTDDQKSRLEQAIVLLKENSVQLFEVGNYEKLYPIGSIGWTADNWFLLLTGNEKDRLGIWMDSQHPLGNILVRRDFNKYDSRHPQTLDHPNAQLNESSNSNPVSQNELFWERIKGPNSQYLFSCQIRLETFINRIDRFSLSHFNLAWLEAITTLQDNYSEYKEYLGGRLDLGQRKDFERIFTPIFTEISDRYKLALQTSAISNTEKLDTYGFGVDNTRKFLTGRNKNIDDWIGRNCPKSS